MRPFAEGLTTVAIGAAVTHWSGIMLTIAALAMVAKTSHQTGVIVYPITNGLVIPTGVVLGAIILKQQVSVRTAVGVGVGIVALVCLFLP